MNQVQFEKLVDSTIAELRELLIVKGGEYAGSEDRLANFKRGAALTGATPMQVLFIYLSKHYDAIATYIRDCANGVDRPRSESINGRIHDAINYLLLLEALVVEDQEGQVNVPATVAKQNSGDRGERPEPSVIRTPVIRGPSGVYEEARALRDDTDRRSEHLFPRDPYR